ncbi:MAG TPA: peptide chain release factor N(5)-glutamine methyltransferase [Verrucomicrobiae bacterium]
MTVLEVIQRSAEFLQRKQVESPRLQAELLLAHVLKMARLKLYLNFERALKPEEEAAMRELVQRRGKREPLQHLVGSVNFCGYELAVSRDVLIPRPETETLAELAWTYINGLPEGDLRALDLGTGSGCLPITIALKSPRVAFDTVDISAAASALARKNAEKHQLNGRVKFLEGDLFAPLSQGQRYHLIISNPPYIEAAEIETLEPEVKDFDPRVALDGGADGLEFYHRLAKEGSVWLVAGGRLMAEFGEGQGPAIQKIFEDHGWAVHGLEKDLSGRERFVIASVRGA